MFVGLLLMGSSASAQERFGHINSLELLSFMPELKAADAKLEAYAKQLEDQNTTMMQEYQGKVDEYQKKEAMMMDAVKEVKQKEILDLEKRIMNFQETAQTKLSSKKEELYTPLLEKADKAIKEIAKEKGYTYIFDTSAGAILYAEESDNIMSLVKAKMGLN